MAQNINKDLVSGKTDEMTGVSDNYISKKEKMLSSAQQITTNPEINEILDDLKGVINFSLHDYWDVPVRVVFPLQYEIIGIEKNVWGTNSWPVINLIYDESKLTSEENDKFMSIISKIVNDDTVGKIKTKLSLNLLKDTRRYLGIF